MAWFSEVSRKGCLLSEGVVTEVAVVLLLLYVLRGRTCVLIHSGLEAAGVLFLSML